MKTSMKSILAAVGAAFFAVLFVAGSVSPSNAADTVVIVCEGETDVCVTLYIPNPKVKGKYIFKEIRHTPVEESPTEKPKH